MNVEKRIEIERKVVRHLIREMKAAGWIITRINDGGEPDEDTINPNETEAMEAIFAVDEAVIYFHKSFGPQRGMTHFASIVLGNDGWDCISDYSCSKTHAMDNFDQIMKDKIDPYCDSLSG